ncbi:MAG: acyltransferase [Bacteroidales bacterium]
MMENTKFDDIRPYGNAEIPEVILRVAQHPYFSEVIKRFFPKENFDDFKNRFLEIKTVEDFQIKVMNQIIWSIIRDTTNGLDYSGFEQLEKNKNYMFISNHRDILLDSAILEILLNKNSFDTSEITFGSNLMQNEWVVDIGKMNKMFMLIRGGNIHDLYKNSLHVSEYMRYTITKKRQSVWIAQRNGRTKDGLDRTEMGVLKMFALSSTENFVENLKELNITPIAISYEYEPCDFLKVAELLVSKYQTYVKSPGEDLNSIIHGIMQPKGKVCLNVCAPIDEQELQDCARFKKNERFECLADMIDQRIFKQYQLWKTNYIAFDMLYQNSRFYELYTQAEKEAFEQYMNKGISLLQGNEKELKKIFLEIYSNPVTNTMERF